MPMGFHHRHLVGGLTESQRRVPGEQARPWGGVPGASLLVQVCAFTGPLASPTLTPERPAFYPEFPLRAPTGMSPIARIRPKANQQGQETAERWVRAHREPQDFAA